MPRATYAEVAAIARRVWLEPLAAHAAVIAAVEPALEPLYRPLGGRLMLRWLRDARYELARADPLALRAAHTMLSAWIAASERDENVIPARCLRDNVEATARALLREEFERHWANFRGAP